MYNNPTLSAPGNDNMIHVFMALLGRTQSTQLNAGKDYSCG